MPVSRTRKQSLLTAITISISKVMMKAMKPSEIRADKQTASTANDNLSIETAIDNSWSKIAPFWPLKNLIAVNPIAGFENLPFEQALKQAKAYFQQQHMPEQMQAVNRESIKWLQAFFDEGQSTIRMPNRQLGLLGSTRLLMPFDEHIHHNDPVKKQWLKSLPQKPEAIIAESLLYLGIPSRQKEQFLTLMLTTLPGWAAYIQYRTSWSDAREAIHSYPITKSDYLAFRVILTCLIWPTSKALLSWHQQAMKHSDIGNVCAEITAEEIAYQNALIEQLRLSSSAREHLRESIKKPIKTKAQLVFCIDVRSEPFRRALEAQGDYQTYGFAGFFGVPVSIENAVTNEVHSSCPVLLKPAHTVVEYSTCSHQSCRDGHEKILNLKKLYQSLKYTFTTPFSLVETIGLVSGIWMGIKSLLPGGSEIIKSRIKNTIAPDYTVRPYIDNIPFEQQTAYGASALKMMGLTENFAPLVVFCGHGSKTQNNAYASALDCGACGGHHGAPNARILACILNSHKVRAALKKQNIHIPQDTFFLAAEHNTTTDAIEFYTHEIPENIATDITSLKKSVEKAQMVNSYWRATTMGINIKPNQMDKATAVTALRAVDWAQVRPEWGLARNAAFIVGPRELTKNVDLAGRAFLHSYNWEKDSDGSLLTTIMTAPMVVAQWINAQYLFSTLDNVAFGAGSKTTKNITGKIGIMQGNASDLMHGLPLQSVFSSDDKRYHQPLRLTVVIYAPQSYIGPIIQQQAILQQLFANGWVHLICDDPQVKQQFRLQRNLQWSKLD